MKYLITGGAGFIGSHLSEKLLKEGHSVTALDNLVTGSRENIKGFIKHPEFRFVESYVEDSKMLEQVISESETIFHLAAAVGVDIVVNNPIHTIETNIRGTENVFQFAAKHNKKVIIASTSEVYGKSTKDTFSETDDLLLGSPVNYRWSYAASKALDEYLGMAYYKEKNLNVTIVRFFNTVGPRQTGQYGMVIPRFVSQAVNGKDITVFGTGGQSRCFCHVFDTVRALMLMDRCENVRGETFNIGSQHEISINQLAEMITKACGSSSNIVHIPYSEAYSPGFEDMLRRKPNIDKINEATGWTPEKSLDNIIEDVKNYTIAN